jgi:predicted amidohydrolase
MPGVTLAAANVKIEWHDKRKNLQRFLEIIDEAADKKVQILVLPEVGLQGYADFGYTFFQPEFAEQRRYYVQESEPIPGPATETIRQAVERHGMYVQLGLAESALHGNIIYNSTALIGPEGVVGVFRKIHCQPDYPWFNNGETMDVFETPHARVGSLICYDVCFPELTRTYVLKGANLLLMSTAWPMKGHERATDFNGQALDLMARSQAYMNQVWIVVSNHCEKGAYSTHDDYYGGSQIVDPGGRVIEYAADEERLVTATVDLDEVMWRVRTEDMFACNLLQDRRPELYGALVDESFKYPRPALGKLDIDVPATGNGRAPEAVAKPPAQGNGGVRAKRRTAVR